jgi:hypothetical protein
MLAPAPGPNHRGIQGVREIGRKVRLILKPDHGAEWDTRLSIPSKEQGSPARTIQQFRRTGARLRCRRRVQSSNIYRGRFAVPGRLHDPMSGKAQDSAQLARRDARVGPDDEAAILCCVSTRVNNVRTPRHVRKHRTGAVTLAVLASTEGCGRPSGLPRRRHRRPRRGMDEVRPEANRCSAGDTKVVSTTVFAPASLSRRADRGAYRRKPQPKAPDGPGRKRAARTTPFRQSRCR